MKKLIVVLLLCVQGAMAQLKNGDPVPDLQFSLLNAPAKATSLSQLKGKVVVIEFWATWCGSCIVAMPHLKELQEKFPDKLRIISVSQETSKRILQFLKIRPSPVWFATDSSQTITNTFPHQLLPHTVLISPDGKLVANTSPELVTASAIDKLLSNQSVIMDEKEDNHLTIEELIDTHFHAADTIKSRFIIQPKIKGAPGFSTLHRDDSTFNGRRITAVNCGLAVLYRIAYGDFSYSRTIDKIPASEKTAYCIDLIVADKQQLLPELRRELAAKFDVHAEMKPEIKDAYVLTISDPEKVKKIPLNSSGKRTYTASHGKVDQQSMTMSDLAEYLESYGVVHLPVIDETKNTARYDIQFSFQPEDPATLTKVLTDMGLTLVKTKKKIDRLYLW